MIYQLYFALIMAGCPASGNLLGSYMMLYAGAHELDLGFVFMIQPLTVFLRPLICAYADRTRRHKQLVVLSGLATGLAYSPFVIVPFLIRSNLVQAGTGTVFWLLALSHLLGSIALCGNLSLGTAMAVNYAKRVGADYACYRKYGSISFGLSAYLMGFINQDWLLPDFVPSLLVLIGCSLGLSLLVHLKPDEYFIITSESQQNRRAEAPCKSEQVAKPDELQVSKEDGERSREEQGSISVSQQVGILKLLFKRDFRIASYLLILFYGGLVGYAGPNFVFTYLNETCHRKATCDAASLAGLVMVSYCLVETCCYLLIDRFRGKLNYLLMVEITFVSLAAHYFFYGYALDHLSPYFFLAESLHGVEYAISLSTSVELGYLFANEVELLIPELIRRDIIRPEDDQELIKVSLMATMSGLMTLVYDGLGSILGSLVYGLTTGHYSFVTTWRVIGTLASCGLVVILVGYLVGKCLGLRPQIHSNPTAKK